MTDPFTARLGAPAAVATMTRHDRRESATAVASSHVSALTINVRAATGLPATLIRFRPRGRNRRLKRRSQ